MHFALGPVGIVFDYKMQFLSSMTKPVAWPSLAKASYEPLHGKTRYLNHMNQRFSHVNKQYVVWYPYKSLPEYTYVLSCFEGPHAVDLQNGPAE